MRYLPVYVEEKAEYNWCHRRAYGGAGPLGAAGTATCVLALLDAIETTSQQARELEALLVQRLQVHADQTIFTSQPKARPRSAPPRYSASSAMSAPASRTRSAWPPRPT